VTDPLLLQVEPVPVTSTLLFKDPEAAPIVPAVFLTAPPLLIVRLLPTLLPPTTRFPAFVHKEPAPVTSTLLFDEVAALPMVPALFLTVPPLVIVRRLSAPLFPTKRFPELVQSEFDPVTSTLLFEEVAALPMVPALFLTVPPLVINRLPLPFNPI
jgi:hypothetical protein